MFLKNPISIHSLATDFPICILLSRQVIIKNIHRLLDNLLSHVGSTVHWTNRCCIIVRHLIKHLDDVCTTNDGYCLSVVNCR